MYGQDLCMGAHTSHFHAVLFWLQTSNAHDALRKVFSISHMFARKASRTVFVFSAVLLLFHVIYYRPCPVLVTT